MNIGQRIGHPDLRLQAHIGPAGQQASAKRAYATPSPPGPCAGGHTDAKRAGRGQPQRQGRGQLRQRMDGTAAQNEGDEKKTAGDDSAPKACQLIEALLSWARAAG